jgi:hypothetical protein
MPSLFLNKTTSIALLVCVCVCVCRPHTHREITRCVYVLFLLIRMPFSAEQTKNQTGKKTTGTLAAHTQTKTIRLSAQQQYINRCLVFRMTCKEKNKSHASLNRYRWRFLLRHGRGRRSSHSIAFSDMRRCRGNCMIQTDTRFGILFYCLLMIRRVG